MRPLVFLAVLHAGGCQTKEWRAWPRLPSSDPVLSSCPFEQSAHVLGFEYLDGSNADPSGPPWVEPPGEHHHSADTWYPTAGRNGKIYTPWTDGKVHGLYSNSGGTLGIATTGMAVVELPPDFVPARDVFKLKVLST